MTHPFPPSPNNPWLTYKTDIVFENNWIKVENSRVRNPAGSDAIYGVVRFKNKAVGIIPGQVFLATELTQGENDLEETEDISVLKIPLQVAYEAVEAGLITDSLTITAIYKLKLMQVLGELE